MTEDLRNILSLPAPQVAPRLLGALLIRTLPGHRLSGRIVEVEAYDESDPASHSFRGQTKRTAVMFGPPGFAYVYFTYGMHYCMNVVTGPVGHGTAVLVRAVEPLEGEEVMAQNRRGKNGLEVTNGPAKVCQAFGITQLLNGHDLTKPPLELQLQPPLPPEVIATSGRIGIRVAKEVMWRFYVKNSPHVSR